jgi:hypothetical protein
LVDGVYAEGVEQIKGEISVVVVVENIDELKN